MVKKTGTRKTGWKVCPDCKDKGWLFVDNQDRQKMEIQRCDTCFRYPWDDNARRAARRQGYAVRNNKLVRVPIKRK